MDGALDGNCGDTQYSYVLNTIPDGGNKFKVVLQVFGTFNNPDSPCSNAPTPFTISFNVNPQSRPSGKQTFKLVTSPVLHRKDGLELGSFDLANTME